MAPIHHHFEKLGWPESRIVVRFWIVSFACAILGLDHDAEGQMTLDLADKRVLVVGLGRSGIAAAQLCAARGARVTVTDKRRRRRAGRRARPRCRRRSRVSWAATGARRSRRADLIVLSPGVPEIPELAAARAAGVADHGRAGAGQPVRRRRRSSPSPAPTASRRPRRWCGAMLAATGRPTFVGGNLGEPLAEAVGTPAAGAGGVLRRRGVQLPAGDGRHVPPARGRPAEHHARPPGSLRRDGRLRGRQGPHLRGPDGRGLRGRQRRRSARRARGDGGAQPAAAVLDHATAARGRLAGGGPAGRAAARREPPRATRRTCRGWPASATTRRTRWRRCWRRGWRAHHAGGRARRAAGVPRRSPTAWSWSPRWTASPTTTTRRGPTSARSSRRWTGFRARWC